jgi:hypothetical protein
VREVALQAGLQIVKSFAATETTRLLPTLRNGVRDSSWRGMFHMVVIVHACCIIVTLLVFTLHVFLFHIYDSKRVRVDAVGDASVKVFVILPLHLPSLLHFLHCSMTVREQALTLLATLVLKFVSFCPYIYPHCYLFYIAT